MPDLRHETSRPGYAGVELTNFNPNIDPIRRKIKNILQKSDGSLKRKMPTITVPTAPIPVQTAYAVPIGMIWIALFRK